MNKTLVACAAGLLFVAGSANAISVSGEAGEHYTNLGVGLGAQQRAWGSTATGSVAIMMVTSGAWG
ncbi:YfaZ precursor [Serratia fonticola]|uniref:YfaZ n=1 Tax=Serratia fonticola TaxID=47917 RepID=A0A448SZN3_SERFO|nr:YfaZ precursor [Serratia fonticola]